MQRGDEWIWNNNICWRHLPTILESVNHGWNWTSLDIGKSCSKIQKTLMNLPNKGTLQSSSPLITESPVYKIHNPFLPCCCPILEVDGIPWYLMKCIPCLPPMIFNSMHLDNWYFGQFHPKSRLLSCIEKQSMKN
jgi:hypothetical protein